MNGTKLGRYLLAGVFTATAVFFIVEGISDAGSLLGAIAILAASMFATLAARAMMCRVDLLDDSLAVHGLFRSRLLSRAHIAGFVPRMLPNGALVITAEMKDARRITLPWLLVDGRESRRQQILAKLETWLTRGLDDHCHDGP